MKTKVLGTGPAPWGWTSLVAPIAWTAAATASNLPAGQWHPCPRRSAWHHPPYRRHVPSVALGRRLSVLDASSHQLPAHFVDSQGTASNPLELSVRPPTPCQDHQTPPCFADFQTKTPQSDMPSAWAHFGVPKGLSRSAPCLRRPRGSKQTPGIDPLFQGYEARRYRPKEAHRLPSRRTPAPQGSRRKAQAPAAPRCALHVASAVCVLPTPAVVSSALPGSHHLHSFCDFGLAGPSALPAGAWCFFSPARPLPRLPACCKAWHG
mmetsp:Transcript_53310/g.116341  ORF Transcript_53310/g.116341 Transcript_53310/m.116341 type:complete len:264 (+) Transcript_53310:494-1285(+)